MKYSHSWMYSRLLRRLLCSKILATTMSLQRHQNLPEDEDNMADSTGVGDQGFGTVPWPLTRLFPCGLFMNINVLCMTVIVSHTQTAEMLSFSLSRWPTRANPASRSEKAIQGFMELLNGSFLTHHLSQKHICTANPLLSIFFQCFL